MKKFKTIKWTSIYRVFKLLMELIVFIVFTYQLLVILKLI